MLKAIKIYLYPNQIQQTEINKLLGCARFVYNYCLGLKIEKYKEDKTSLKIGDLNKELILLKNTEDHSWLKEAHSKVMQQVLMNLDKAYKNFFKFKKGFPVFKKKNQKQSCRFPVDAISGVVGNRINLITKLRDIHFKCSVKDEKYLNKYQSCIKSATLSKTKTGKYVLSVLIDRFADKNEQVDGIVGIDLGIKDFVIDSNGNKYENIKIKTNAKTKKKLKTLNRRLSKKQKGSKNKEKARQKLAQFQEKLNNKKENYLHYVVNQLLNDNQVVVMEDLNVNGMMKNHKLARSLQELSLGEFKRILQYKADWQGKTVIEIGRFYPSSKLCNNCKYKNKDLKLSDREWLCPGCGVNHDRDVNAANNILDEGLRIYEKISGRSTSEELVENSNVDGEELISQKSNCSLKQESKVVRLAGVNKMS